VSRIEAVFKDKKAYIAYLTAGDGGLDTTLSAMQALVKGGVDIIEVGVPFSDPVADGPVIAEAADRAVKSGVTLQAVLKLIHSFREFSDVPIILFTYYNPLLQAQKQDVYRRAKEAGVDGCLVVDLPLVMSSHHEKACLAHGLDPIYILTPNTPIDQLKKINAASRGMLYYASRKGVTGVKKSLTDDFSATLSAFKREVTLPIAAGFGIADRDTAAKAIEVADGFVVGSRFVNAISQGIDNRELIELVRSIDPR